MVDRAYPASYLRPRGLTVGRQTRILSWALRNFLQSLGPKFWQSDEHQARSVSFRVPLDPLFHDHATIRRHPKQTELPAVALVEPKTWRKVTFVWRISSVLYFTVAEIYMDHENCRLHVKRKEWDVYKGVKGLCNSSARKEGDEEVKESNPVQQTQQFTSLN